MLSIWSKMAMFSGLVAGYGVFASIAGRFLYPAKEREKRWMYVAETGRLTLGQAVLYRAPTGETINIARQGNAGGATDFIALSSTCPHLGCQVHWEAQHDRFFCPCHNGIFSPSGQGVSGPPGDAGMSLPRYDLKVESGLLYIEVPVDSLTADGAQGEIIDRVAGIHGPGHDPCLVPRTPRTTRS